MIKELGSIGSRLMSASEEKLIRAQTIRLPGGIVFTCHPDAVKLAEGIHVDRVSNGFAHMQELFGGENSVTSKWESRARKEAKQVAMENFATKPASAIVNEMSKAAELFLNSNRIPSQMTAPEFHGFIAQWVTSSTMKGLFGIEIDRVQATQLSEYARAVFVSSATADLLGNNRIASQLAKVLGYDGDKAGRELRTTAEAILNTSDAPLIHHLRDIPDEVLSPEQKIAEIAVLIGGSTGNTAHTLTHLLMSLSDPALQKYQTELRTLDPQSEDYTSKINSAMYETFRMYPAVPFIRRTVTEPIKLGDTDIQPGTKLVISLHTMQRDPAKFNKPGQFDPQRDGSSWRLSFGSGKRSCSGVQVAVREIPMFAGQFFNRYQTVTNGETQQPIHGFPFIAYNPAIKLCIQ